MQDFLGGETVNLSFKYGDGHEPRIPTVGSVTYTVLNHSGNPITGLVDLPVTTDVATFQSTIVIPAENNEIVFGKNFERRTVLVRYTSNGHNYSQRIGYRLTPFLNHTVTPDTVRSFLGVNKNELEDKDIDLYSAYLYVSEAFDDPVTLADALSSGDRLEIYANDAIAMRAAIDLIPSLQNRIVQSEKDGVRGYDRIKIKDFGDLMATAIDRYNNAVGVIGELDLLGGEYTLIQITQDTDPITAGQTG